MYEYVDKALIKPYRKQCTIILEELRGKLAKKGIKVKIIPVGSGANNVVTRNGDGPFDLDYNICIGSNAPSSQEDLRHLKDTIRTTLDQLLKIHDMMFSFGQDSTSVMTYLCYGDCSGKVDFKLDLGIIMEIGKQYKRLIHDKQRNAYRWETVRDARKAMRRANNLRHEGYQKELREAYLRLKNKYLQDKSRTSFVIYIEAVNLVWQKYGGAAGK